ncbi:unnamed protein product, partial [Brenthis ino]
MRLRIKTTCNSEPAQSHARRRADSRQNASNTMHVGRPGCICISKIGQQSAYSMLLQQLGGVPAGHR